VEARTARWLLQAADAAQTADMELTHDLVAQMLGIRRPRVSEVVARFARAGLIRAERGRISVADGIGLAELACECYDTVRSELGRFASA